MVETMRREEENDSDECKKMRENFRNELSKNNVSLSLSVPQIQMFYLNISRHKSFPHKAKLNAHLLFYS